VVTGGVGLLGAEFCRTLAEAGADVAVVDLNASAAEVCAESLRNNGYKALALPTDITQPNSVNAAVEKVLSTFGRLDILVNSAALDPKFDPEAIDKGITPGAFEDYPLDLWNSALNVNLTDIWGIVIELASDLKNYDVVESFRDKQYYLSEARIKLYELTRRAQKNLSDPEATLLVEIVEKWQELIITEGKVLRGPAELQLALLNKRLAGNGEWNNILVTVKNVGQSPAENIFVSLLENENVLVLENKKRVRLLGTGDVSNIEFAIMSKGNPSELRLYFDASFDDFERKGKLFTFADVIGLTGAVEEFKKIENPYVVGIPLQSDKVFYGRRKVLDFALDNLRAGEQNNVLIFYGQRRIGKSSLLYILGLLDLPDAGRVSIESEPVSQLSDDELAHKRSKCLGFIFQFHFLMEDFTAQENVMIPMRKLGQLADGEMRERAAGLLESVGLGDKLRRPSRHLSGGEQQRVAIARALANDPRVILADEPTGNLDTANSERAFELLQNIVQQGGKALLLATHNPVIAESCDWIHEMKDGRITASNPRGTRNSFFK